MSDLAHLTSPEELLHFIGEQEAEIAKLRAALEQAGVMLSVGFSKKSVEEHLQAALTNEQKP